MEIDEKHQIQQRKRPSQLMTEESTLNLAVTWQENQLWLQSMFSEVKGEVRESSCGVKKTKMTHFSKMRGSEENERKKAKGESG